MSQTLSRRGILAAAGAAALAPSSLLGQTPSVNRRRPRGGPKNIIWLVSDGMSMGALSMADMILEMRSEGKAKSAWRELMRDPRAVNGLQDTRSLSSVVTDSAAAGSAWGSGTHVWNGVLNMLPDGTKLTPLYTLLGAQGMKRGLVSTATITHATPAGFAINMDQRDKEAQIAEEYLKTGIDVFMGGGDRFFSAASRDDKKDLYAEFAKAGYEVVKDKKFGSGTGKLLGIFSPSHVPYAIDRANDPRLIDVPSLPAMMTEAIRRLEGGKDGFVLQVEAARVDHAAHANDAAGLIYDQIEFEECVRLAHEYAQNHPDTLIVVTSDHGNSNPGIIGSGPEYGAATPGLRRVLDMTASYEAMQPEMTKAMALGASAGADAVVGLLKSKLGIELTADEVALVVANSLKQGALKTIEQYQTPGSALGIALGNHSHIGWSGRQHTNDYTVVTAFGPGADRFHGMVPNKSVFGKLLGLRGITHVNPAMDFATAQSYMKRAEIPNIDGHWL